MVAPVDAALLDRIRRRIREADGVVVLTGAGVSAESGVPTFRGEEGLWKRHRPEELATPGAFRRDARLVWEWYAYRRRLVASCEPNPAHRALASFQARRSDVTLVTQNVDGLHHRAAAEESGRADAPPPVELHGSLFRVRCTGCSHRSGHREPVDATSRATLPRCPSCGSLLRPDVVWFGESLDDTVLAEAFAAAREAELCLVVGTSAVVQPAASLPLATLEAGGAVVEVNPDVTPLTSRTLARLPTAAGAVLPELLAADRATDPHGASSHGRPTTPDAP